MLTVVIAVALATVDVYAGSAQEASAAVKKPKPQEVVAEPKTGATAPADSASPKKKVKLSKKERAAAEAAATLPKGIETANQAPQKRFKVEGGVLKEVTTPTAEKILAGDSTAQKQAGVEGVQAADTTLKPLKGDLAGVTPKEAEEKEEGKHKRKDDTSTVRYSALFKDTIPLSRMTAISLIAPGFSQLYNKQAWKIPILYGVTGGLATLGFMQSSKYKEFKGQYNDLVAQQATQEQLTPVQNQMIKYNTTRTVMFAGAIASYLYFLADGVLNYKGPNSSVKKATTLSTICPGAGQMYNRSYWKVPIIVGAFATMGYVIDWNSRGFNRYRKAYNQVVAGEPDEFGGRYSADYLKNMKDNFRRNRDFCLIITGALYLLNIVDAHVDAHLKDYDISDDLAIRLEPTIIQTYTATNNVNGVGMALKFTF